MEKKPRMLTFKEYMHWVYADVFNHHGFTDYEKFEKETGTDNTNMSEVEVYEAYKRWYFRRYTKLGQVLK